MGMYDTINGEQVKIFYRCYPRIAEDDSVVLNGVSGNLEYFDVGNRVPYRSYYYNMGTNFDIIDFEPYENPEPMIHQIRKGINKGFKFLSEIDDSEFADVAYSDRGAILKNISKENIKDHICRMEMIRNAELESSEVSTEICTYLRKCSKKEIEFDEAYLKEMQDRRDKLRKEEDETIFKIIHEGEKIEILGDHMEEMKCDNFQLLGAIVEDLCIVKDRNTFGEDGVRFVVNDERLEYIVFADKMNELLKEIDLEKYFKTFAFTKKEKEQFKRKIADINAYCEMTVKKVKVKKEDINEQYLLNDILNGKHKALYLKFGIEPYIGFDYKIWDNLEENKNNKSKKITKEKTIK